MKRIIIAVVAIIVVVGVAVVVTPAVVLNLCDDVGCRWFRRQPVPAVTIETFEACVAAGNAIMESYPRQCRAGDRLFTETVTVAPFTSTNVNVTSPLPNSTVQSPLVVTGEAKGPWYFEASFPVILKDGNGNILAQAPAQAQGDWMTTNFVPFQVILTFTTPNTPTGTLIFQKDNPSGLPQNDAQEQFTVQFL